MQRAAMLFALMMVAIMGCHHGGGPSPQPSRSPYEVFDGWLNIAYIPSPCDGCEERLRIALSNQGIESGFHGSRGYALIVRVSDAKLAREIIRPIISDIPHAGMFPDSPAQ